MADSAAPAVPAVHQVETIIDHPHRFERALSTGIDNALDMATTYGLRTIGALIILLVGWFVARQVQRAMVRVGERSARVDLTVAAFVGALAKYLIIAFTLIAILSSYGVETTSVVTILGAAGLAIGLALQGTLSHVAAGFMLVMFRPFRVGDTIETAGVTGTVTEVGLFTTEIRNADNVRVIVPNNAVWSGITKNMTSNTLRRLELEIPIPYGADSAAATKIVAEVVATESRILGEPVPVIGITRFTDLNARLVVQVWVHTADVGAVQLALNTALRDQLGRAGHLK